MRGLRRRRQGRQVLGHSGFSLAEILASISVFAIAATGLMTTTMSTIRTNSASRHMVVASTLIHDKVEELRSLDPSLAPADFDGGEHEDVNNPLTALGESGGSYVRTWEVFPDTPRIGMAEVVISIRWTDAHGEQTMQATTFICRSVSCG